MNRPSALWISSVVLVCLLLAATPSQGTGAYQWLLLHDGSGISPAPGREHTQMVYNPDSNCMSFFGGHDTTYRNDVWRYSFTEGTWTQLHSGAGGPTPVQATHNIYDPGHNALVTYGGGTAGSQLGDTWSFSLDQLQWFHVLIRRNLVLAGGGSLTCWCRWLPPCVIAL